MAVPQPTPPLNPPLEDGSSAWLRYHVQSADALPSWLITVYGAPDGPIRDELTRFAREAGGDKPTFLAQKNLQAHGLHFIQATTDEFGSSLEGFTISTDASRVEIRAASEAGFLYGTFALLRRALLGQPLTTTSAPFYETRMLNQWDDPVFDHTMGPFNVTRGMAGNSVFNWEDLPRDNPRIRAYARLMASVGINAICINNVNANPDLLETRYLAGLVKLANDFRPYGIRIYVAVAFSAPMVTDGVIGTGTYGPEFHFCMRQRKRREQTLESADPLDPIVQAWWRTKADEIYAEIPDFGGFVIKANSEGMPGPQDYGRTHADGANCLARGLAPHGGKLFYRTFIYHGADKTVGPRDPRFDGVNQPYLEFHEFDGEFDDNVILQTKSGPADFRVDEPPSPLFGTMPETRQAVEFMIAQEYMGYTTHTVFQGGNWQEVLNFDTHQQGAGSTVAAVTAGKHRPYSAGAIVGVANTGDDPNWFGHHFAGANFYVFGALAWTPQRSAHEIAKEWAALTFAPSEQVADSVAEILRDSYQLYARYTVPLGMNLMHESAHHFEPDPQKFGPMTWNEQGAGYNRTVATGTQYVGQYHPNAGRHWEDPATTPIPQLLFFHYLPWEHTMPTGETLLDYIQRDRTEAVEAVREWMNRWEALRGELDALRWAQIFERLYRQYMHACKWRDAGFDALRRIGKLPLAAGSSVDPSVPPSDWDQLFSTSLKASSPPELVKI